MSPSRKSDRPLAVYVRVSEQGKRDDEELRSPDLQERRIREWAESHGLKVTSEVFVDIDRKGSTMNRAGLNAALAGVRERRCGGIIVARLSRFARSLAGGTRVEKQIRLLGGQLVAVDFPIDTTTPVGRQMFRSFLGWFEYELDNLAESQSEVLDAKIAEGVYVSGKPPAGYDYEIVGSTRLGKPIRGKLVPNEHASAIRAAFELRAGPPLASFGAVADLLNERGVPTAGSLREKNPTAGRWTAPSAASLIGNEVYTGVVKSGGVRKLDEETGEEYTTKERRREHAHEAIVPAWLWRRANPAREKRPRVKGDGHLLGQGLCRCGLCGAGLVRSYTQQGKYAQLRCPGRGKGHASISYRRAADTVVSQAVEHIGLLLSAIQIGENGAEVEATEARLAQARAELAEVEAAEDELSPLAFGRALDKARSTVEEAEDALAALDRAEAWWARPYLLTIAGGNRLAFEALPLPEQRRFLHEQIARATLKPGRGAPEARIEIEWQQEPGPRRIETEGWTVLEFSDWAGLAFQGVPPDAPLTSETLDMLREQALAEFRRGGALRRGATQARTEAVSDTAAQEALEGGDRATQTERREQTRAAGEKR